MQISEAESVVMEVLWRGSPRSSEEVITELSRDQDWQVSTIKTLLGRLVKKGAVKAAKDGRRFSYSPVLTREAWARSQSSNLLERVFDGRLAPLIAHFTETHKLSPKDIADVKRLLKDLDNGK
ncbi:BlaI/MecI/CopY family transcriptional regulator [Arenimonas sp.]|uniref:BlaI/MecI/CopY family transcriptional regulator n=1 Tax=Arenimonas sp. TaxID=1872635 RepID=UPI0025BFB686|nr:BlaI/MecI/CopY family transcriptional regulator [Arenimonas sp.]